MKKKKHDWASLQSYLNAHERVLNTYAKFMERPRQYKQTLITPNYLLLECTDIMFTTYLGNKARVDLTKDVEIDDAIEKRPKALTTGYSYNANRPGLGNLIRYDSPDDPTQMAASAPHHHNYHHKHDWSLGKEQIIKVGDDEWPHVDEFIREVLSTF